MCEIEKSLLALLTITGMVFLLSSITSAASDHLNQQYPDDHNLTSKFAGEDIQKIASSIRMID
jgi:hypothetical protein